MTKMATINEDLFESQHNSSTKKTRNNADLRDVVNIRSPNKKSFTDLSSLSNILGDKDLSASITSARNKNYKHFGLGKSKGSINSDYGKFFHGSMSSRETLTKTHKTSSKGISFCI